MAKQTLLLLLLLLLIGSVDAAWMTPPSYNTSYGVANTGVCSVQEWGSPTNGIDNNIATNTHAPYPACNQYAQYIVYNLGGNYTISGINASLNAVSAPSTESIPIIGIGPLGETNLCTLSVANSGVASYTCSYGGTELFDRIKIKQPSGDSYYLLVAEVSANVVSYVAQQQAGGPCRTFCDYTFTHYVPSPSDGSTLTNKVWNITFTDSLTNPEGEAYINNTWENVQIIPTNGTTSGSCSGFVTGNITSIQRLTNTGRQRLLVTYQYGNVSAGGCTMTPPYVSMCFNGTRQGYTIASTGSDTGTESYSYSVGGDATKYYHYNLSYNHEVTNTAFDFTNYVPASTNFICSGAYTGFLVPLNVVGGSYIVQTKTPADLSTTLSNGFNRKLATSGGGVYTVYLLNNTTPYNTYNFQLYDYASGLWSGSTLGIQTAIGDNMSLINSERFSVDGVSTPVLRNNTLYKIFLNSSAGFLDLGTMWLDSTLLDRKIIANQPNVNQYYGNYYGLTPGWTWDYTTGQLGATITSSQSTQATFTVYDATTSPYTSVYTTTGSGTNIVFTYGVSDKQKTYYMDLSLNDTRYGILEFQKLVLMYNQSMPMNTSALNQPLPEDMLNVASTFVKALISAFIIIFVFFVTCKASDYGLGMIMGCLTFMFAWYVNWVPQTEVPFWFTIVMLLIAVLAKMHERRAV